MLFYRDSFRVAIRSLCQSACAPSVHSQSASGKIRTATGRECTAGCDATNSGALNTAPGAGTALALVVLLQDAIDVGFLLLLLLFPPLRCNGPLLRGVHGSASVCAPGAGTRVLGTTRPRDFSPRPKRSEVQNATPDQRQPYHSRDVRRDIGNLTHWAAWQRLGDSGSASPSRARDSEACCRRRRRASANWGDSSW